MALNFDAVGKTTEPKTFEYTTDDVILYHLGIGCETSELQFLYENGLVVIPTFGVIASGAAAVGALALLEIPLEKLLHGENRIEVFRPIPPRGKIVATNTIKGVYDKGRAALAITEIEGRTESGESLFKNTVSLFVRGEGGFGGERGPTRPKNNPPDRPPDATVELKTHENQAQIYRLSGDKNPLHVDPAFAKLAGFEKPILHGLCTYGYVARAIMRAYCENDPARLKAIDVRFSGVVYPGETLVTEMWEEGEGKVLFRTRADGERLVINHAAAEIG